MLQKKLEMPIEPNPGLLAMENPFDWVERNRHGYGEGVDNMSVNFKTKKAYIYFGVVPAVLIHAPWQVVTGKPMPPIIYVSITVALILLFQGLLIKTLSRENTPAWRLAAGMLICGVSTNLPLLTRFSFVYEQSILASALFTTIAAWTRVCEALLYPT